jgi:hypothetical protein
MSDLDQAVRTFVREIDAAIEELIRERNRAMDRIESSVKAERDRAAWLLEKAADEHTEALGEYEEDQKDERYMSEAMADQLRRLAAQIRKLGDK